MLDLDHGTFPVRKARPLAGGVCAGVALAPARSWRRNRKGLLTRVMKAPSTELLDYYPIRPGHFNSAYVAVARYCPMVPRRAAHRHDQHRGHRPTCWRARRDSNCVACEIDGKPRNLSRGTPKFSGAPRTNKCPAGSATFRPAALGTTCRNRPRVSTASNNSSACPSVLFRRPAANKRFTPRSVHPNRLCPVNDNW